jgi:glycerate kinase
MDSFKGSIGSADAGAAVARGVLAADPHAWVTVIATADGGEGTLDALATVHGARRARVAATDLLGRPVTADYVILGDSIIIESASVLGLPLLPQTPQGKPDPASPRVATSLGLGLLARALIDEHQPRRLVIGLGGTGCSDGGTGMIVGLGGTVLDAEGTPIDPREANPVLRGACAVRLPDLGGVEVIGLTDVTAALTGPTGAAHVFAAQKGADQVTVGELEDGLQAWGHALGVGVAAQPGAGAAGGIGAALAALGGELHSGVEWILDAEAPLAFERADMVFTGEGRIDTQSSMGKVPDGVAQRAVRQGARTVVALAGSVEAGASVPGIDSVFPIHSSPVTLAEAMDPAVTARALENTARQVTALARGIAKSCAQ